MCYSALPPHTPSAESNTSSSSLPLASLSSQQSHPPPDTTTHEGSVRKRVVRACEVCRRKKVKCNGQKPCDQCIAYAEECSYVDVKDRSAYSRRYVESLEARILELERRVDHLYTMPPGQNLGGGGMRRASDPGYSGWAEQNERVHRTSQLRLTPMDDAVDDDLTSLSCMSLATAGVGTASGAGQQNVSSQAVGAQHLSVGSEQLGGASSKRFRAATLPQTFAPTNQVSHALQARLSTSSNLSAEHSAYGTTALAFHPQANVPPMQWLPHESLQGRPSSHALAANALNAAASQQQHQQHDQHAPHAQIVASQSPQQPFVVNQQNLMAGFLDHFIQQDQHTRRQAP